MNRLEPVTVLMTGSGAPGAPGIIKSLRANPERAVTIVGVDANPANSGAWLVDRFFPVPRPSEKAFVPALLRICRENSVRVILPLVTRELLTLAANADRFAQAGVGIPISPPQALRIASNKASLLQFLLRSGIPTPRFAVARSLEEFEAALRDLGHPRKTVCFKPPESNGSRGFRIIDDSVDQLDLLLNYKPDNTFITRDNAVEILKRAGEFPPLLVMEFLPGDEYSVDLLVDRGRVLYALPRRRQTITGGISSVCSVVKNAEIEEYCRRIAEALQLNGNIGIQVRADERGRYRILEINPRVQGTIVLCTAAGVNLPYLGIKLALGEPIPPDLEVRWGLTMYRFYEEVYVADGGESFRLG